MNIRVRKRWAVACVVLLAASFCAVGCTDDGNNGTNNIAYEPRDVVDDDSGDAGESDADTSSDIGDDIGTDGSTDADTDTDPPVTELCDGLVDLGTIEASGGATHTANVSSGTNLLDPSCGTSGNNEVVYKFNVDGPARVNVEVESQASTDWVLSLHRGSCNNPTRVKCEDTGADVFVVDPSETYFLAVEPKSNLTDASYSLSLATTALECAPMGSTSCSGDSVTRCESGFNEVTYSCAYACENTACGADICDSAIEVAGAGSHTFTGALAGYGSNFNFQNRDDCTSASVGVNTSGQDLVFYLPGLTEGTELTVDTSASELQQAIFVLDGACSQDAACATGGLQVDGVLEWTVEADGDYYVVVDALEQETGDFNVTISR